MSDSVDFTLEKKPRLKFIDMARSVAILLMLEGHFTGAALSNEFRDSKYWLYNLWHNVHGLTSPLFFTVTGIIFVYLLSANNKIGYFENFRVRKGFKRVAELIFWGYFIQLNLWSIIQSFYYGSEFHLEWLYAFHVLQSIGVGIFLLLIIYGIYKWIGRGALYWYYLIGALIIFGFYGMMKNYIMNEEELVATGMKAHETYFPKNAPSFIQNMFYGQFSDFSFVRYSGYTILGGMLGSLIRTFESKTRELWFCLTFIFVGLFLNFFIQTIFQWLDSAAEWSGLVEKGVYELNATAFYRFGQVMVFLGLLMILDKYADVKAKLFLKIGQNTLPIYVVHVIILYGGVFGFGLKPLIFDENLHPAVAASISLFFIIFFALMVHFIEPLTRVYLTFINFFSFKKK